MSKENQRTTTFLGTIYPFASPKSINTQQTPGHGTENILPRSQGEDHTVSHRHRLSLHRYPKDCPPLKVRWFYAVDSPKWKPTYLGHKKDDRKPLPLPKKFIPFMFKDSQSIENAFQTMSDIEIEQELARCNRPVDGTQGQLSDKVPVNEDYLYDVDVKRRELSPAYWSGPVYEVRRGTWFFQDGSTFKPCEENLGTQLEEGYLKVKPWRLEEFHGCSSQNQPKPASTEQECTSPSNLDVPGYLASAPTNEARKYRLFGSYMNSLVTYQDSSTALIINDDFMSRVSTTVYQKLGGVPGTKVVRGFTETKKQNDTPATGNSDHSPPQELPRISAGSDSVDTTNKHSVRPSSLFQSEAQQHANVPGMKMRPEFEPRVSSVNGTPDTTDLEEQTRIKEEEEIEASRVVDNEDREREIDHLVLVTHGIGQRLGLRLESINFIHDVNVLRKSMKSVYMASPDLQAFNSAFPDKHNNCRVQVLPVCWRHLLDFPYHRVGQSRKELDLADADTIEDDSYPTLADITLESVPAFRNLVSDLAVDVLLYQSTYCEHISTIVKQECNRIFELFKKRNPTFTGSVSLCGHSLGSAILFDILCSEPPKSNSPEGRDDKNAVHELSLAFECEELFCLGSPIALFQMLKGNTIVGRFPQTPGNSRDPLHSQEGLDLSSTFKHPSVDAGLGAPTEDKKSAVSSPRCRQLYNIFHPSDPVGYRLEPLISPAMSSLKPQPLPSVKKSIWTASGQSLSLIGSRVGQSVGSLWTNITSGVASSLLNRSLGLNAEDTPSQPSSNTNPQFQRTPPFNIGAHSDRNPTLIDPDIETLYKGFQKAKGRLAKPPPTESVADRDEYQETERHMKKIKTEDEKVRSLNSNGRVDYSIQEGAFDISLIASIASHLIYWADEDVNHFILSQMLCRKSRHQKSL